MRVPSRQKLLRTLALVFNLSWFQEDKPSISITQTVLSRVGHRLYKGMGPRLSVVVHNILIATLNQYHGEKLRAEWYHVRKINIKMLPCCAKQNVPSLTTLTCTTIKSVLSATLIKLSIKFWLPQNLSKSNCDSQCVCLKTTLRVTSWRFFFFFFSPCYFL